MKYFKRSLVLLSLLVMFYSCRKGSNDGSTVAVFLDKVEKSSDSISIVGHMTGNPDSYELKFLSGFDSNSSVNWFILNSVNMKATSKFRYTYSRYNLNPNSDYSFKVNLFSGTDNYTSNIITLKADVYKLTVDSISPKNGVIGDTVKIYGKNFGSKGLGYGFIGNVKCTTVHYSDSVISVVVPPGLTKEVSSVAVSVNNNVVVGSIVFTHLRPVITDFSPKSAGINTIITVSGKNFCKLIDYNLVSLKSLNITVIKSSQTQLQIQLPAVLPISGRVKINIKVAMNSSDSGSFLTLDGSLIDAINPKSGFGSDLVTISGVGFGTSGEALSVMFGQQPMVIESVSDHEVKARIPYDAAINSDCISLIVNNKTCFSIDSFLVTSPWTLTDLAIPTFTRIRASGFVIDQTIFIGGGFSLGTLFYTLNNDLWSLNTVTGKWSPCDSMPGYRRQRPVGFSINNLGYMGLGDFDAIPFSDLWEYNPTTNTWKRMADFPGTAKPFASCQIINNKAYFAFDFSSEFWEFDVATNKWTQKGDLPAGSKVNKGSFTLGNYGYYLLDDTQLQFWRYDPSNDTWTTRSRFPGGWRDWGVGFAINGYGFFGLADKMGGDIRDMWKYDSTEDKWLKLADFPIPYTAFTLPFIAGNNGWFLLGSDIYMGVKLWKFNPFN